MWKHKRHYFWLIAALFFFVGTIVAVYETITAQSRIIYYCLLVVMAAWNCFWCTKNFIYSRQAHKNEAHTTKNP